MLPEQIAEVEVRMRDPEFSDDCFLGASESLPELVRADADVLRELGITHRRIARRIEAIVDLANRAANQRDGTPEHQARMMDLCSRVMRNELDLSRALEMEHELNAVVVAKRFRVRIVHYHGSQHCPFGYRETTTEIQDSTLDPQPLMGRESCGYGSSDYDIENLISGESIFVSELIIHLIRDHEFFEGIGLPYRLDPRRAIRVLEMM